MYRIPIHKKRKTSKTDCVVWDLAMEREMVTTKSHKKTEFSSRRRHSFAFKLSSAVALKLFFFCVESKRERCLLNDFYFRWWWFFLLLYILFFGTAQFSVLSKFSIAIKRKRAHPTAAWWQHVTLHSTLLYLTGNLCKIFFFLILFRFLICESREIEKIYGLRLVFRVNSHSF